VKWFVPGTSPPVFILLLATPIRITFTSELIRAFL
jgi:hypothetical protein